MILFGASISPFVRKVLMFANEKGLALEHKPLSPHADDAAFKAASPAGKIPAFQDGDYCLADSSAIVHYLDAKYPENPLIPQEPKARGKVIWFEEYADTVLFPVGTVIFINRVLLPKLREIDGDEAKAAESAEKLPPLFAYLESVVPAEGFLVGSDLTLADIAVCNQLINLDHSGITVDAAAYPRLAAFQARLSGRPSVSAVVAVERRMLGA